MSTWSTGRRNLIEHLRASTEPLEQFIKRVHDTKPVRVSGTGIFMTAPKLGAPPMLQCHLQHNQMLHQQVVLLTVITEDVPYVRAAQRLECQALTDGFYTVVVQYGFMQRPDIPLALRGTRKSGLVIEPESTTYYVGKESLVMGGRIPGMTAWRDRLFAFMSRNALRATDFYQIPPERTVEIGIRLRLSELHAEPETQQA